MRETEKYREKELGRPFSVISSNPKYNADYLEKSLKQNGLIFSTKKKRSLKMNCPTYKDKITQAINRLCCEAMKVNLNTNIDKEVFVSISPHVNGIRVSVHKDGWNINETECEIINLSYMEYDESQKGKDFTMQERNIMADEFCKSVNETIKKSINKKRCAASLTLKRHRV